MSKANQLNDGIGEIINRRRDGSVFNPSTITLSDELSAELFEIMNKPIQQK